MPQHSTVNHSEVKKFAAMADDWWNENGKFKQLHIMNPERLRFVKKNIIEHFEAELDCKSVLDVGCGGGLLSAPLARMGAKVTGIDVLAENIAVASRYCAEHKITNAIFQQISVEALAATGVQFDVVLCMEVLEHVDNVPLFIQSLSKLVSPNGLLIVSTINRTIKALLLAKIAAEYVLRFVPVGTHDWHKFLTPDEVIGPLQNSGCSIKSTAGMQFNLLTNSWHISDNLDVNYFIVAECG